MKLSGVSHLRRKKMIVIIAVVVFYFYTYAKHRLEKVVRHGKCTSKFGDNYPSVGSLCLAVSMFLPVMFLQLLISLLIGS